MRTTRLRRWTLSFAALLCMPAYGAETPQQPYRWTCKAQGFFAMTVTPDGVEHPVAEPMPPNPIQITIRERSQYSFGQIGPYEGRYVISLEGHDVGAFTFKGEDYYPSGARLRFSSLADQPGQLDSVEAIYWGSPVEYKPTLLSLRRADKDWVFFVYKGDLTTDAEARRLNIQAPNSEEPIVCGRARAYKRWSHPSSECARPAAAPERDGRGSSTALTNTASNNAPIGLGIRAPLPPT
jgi:hypothetical protein